MPTDFESSVLVGLSSLQAGQRAMNEHLRVLNGKVAQHEKSIGEIQVAQAAHRAEAAADRRWVDIVMPVVYTLVGAVLATGIPWILSRVTT